MSVPGTACLAMSYLSQFLGLYPLYAAGQREYCEALALSTQTDTQEGASLAWDGPPPLPVPLQSC